MSDAPGRVRQARTANLSPEEVQKFGRSCGWHSRREEGFTEDDWDHAVGGVHFVIEIGEEVVAHASVVERDLHIGDVPVRTGYVEAVAVEPARQGTDSGLG